MMVRVDTGRVPLAALKGTQPFFLIHGGAGPADPRGERATRAREAIVAIAQRTAAHSPQTSLAEHLALFAARALEEEPLFNAGRGAALQGDGVVRVSAAFMESTRQKFSAVMNVQGILHPSALAFHLQRERFSCLDALGAQTLASRLGIPSENLETPYRRAAWEAMQNEEQKAHTEKSSPENTNTDPNKVTGGKGTVGCVAIDAQGRLAAVTSTGGVGNETPGRVGDTPTVAGTYCTEHLAVSCTGYGEQILACAFAARLATRVDDGLSLEAAMQKGIEEAAARGFGLAAIAVARHGEEAVWAAGTTEGSFIWAGHDTRSPLVFAQNQG